MLPTISAIPDVVPFVPRSRAERRRNVVVFVDPLQVEEEHKGGIEIHIPGRRTYSGSPVGVKDPIALQYLAAYFESHGYECPVLLQGLLSDEEIVRRIVAAEDELVAVCIALHSTYLVPTVLALATLIKRHRPEVPIIVGGYHPTGDPAIVEDPSIDYAVLGEGEESCLELVEALQDGPIDATRAHQVRGLAFLGDDGSLATTPARGRLDFSSMPWPKREEEILALCQPGPLSYPPVGRVAQIAYSRGCPYDCSFCASPGMWNRRITYRSAEDLAAEMESLIVDYGVNNFFFCDLSFNGNRKKLLELAEAVIRMKRRVGVPFGSHVMCTSTMVDPTILGKMKEANFWKIDYGIEDILEGTIERVKAFQKIDKIKRTLQETNEAGILMRGLMIIGFPWETEETIRLREESIQEFPVDQLRICFFTPFKGTALYSEVKDRILVGAEGFTTDQPPIRCDGIDTEGLRAAVPRLLRLFYNSQNYVDGITRKCTRFPELADSYWYFVQYLHRKGLMDDPVHARLTEVTSRMRSRVAVSVQ